MVSLPQASGRSRSWSRTGRYALGLGPERPSQLGLPPGGGLAVDGALGGSLVQHAGGGPELLRGGVGVAGGRRLAHRLGLGLQPGAHGLVPEPAALVLAVALYLGLYVCPGGR